MHPAAPLPTLSLPDGSPMPRFGLGTWRMGEGRRTQAGERAALRLALELGYRLFDTAEMYGEGGAESLLGEALAAAQRGPLPRDALFVVSKVYPHHASAAGVVAACERSLKRLRLDHLDLYLLHWRGAEPLAETVRGFAQLRRRGLIRHWGVSNFDLADMQELMAVPGGTACASNQVWYSLGRRGVEFDLLPWQQARQMPLMAYSPIDQGALAEHAGLAALAARHGLTPGQLALAWALARPGVVAIPKSSDPLRLRQNLEAAQRSLPSEALDALDRLFPSPRRRQTLAVG
jgi:diketogulonate reductase-like aldo/keto reductase